MAKKYLYKRFRRNPEPKPFRLQPQDVEVLKQLADYRFLTTYQILALQPGASATFAAAFNTCFTLA